MAHAHQTSICNVSDIMMMSSRDLTVDGCKGQNGLAVRVRQLASCTYVARYVGRGIYVTCTTVDCELCILERCRASFVQQDHAHLRI